MIYGVFNNSILTMGAAGAARQLAASPYHASFISRLTGPASADVIDVVFISDPAGRWQKFFDKSRKPTVAVIGDDPGNPEGQGGPDAWQCVQRLRYWAQAAMIHATGGQPEHYAEAVRAALIVNRVALIETPTIHADAWVNRLRLPHMLKIIPREGAHPIREAVH